MTEQNINASEKQLKTSDCFLYYSGIALNWGFVSSTPPFLLLLVQALQNKIFSFNHEKNGYYLCAYFCQSCLWP